MSDSLGEIKAKVDTVENLVLQIQNKLSNGLNNRLEELEEKIEKVENRLTDLEKSVRIIKILMWTTIAIDIVGIIASLISHGGALIGVAQGITKDITVIK